MKDTTACPECGDEAQVQWRDVLESTDGPVEHAKLWCRRGHSFLLPLYLLERSGPDREPHSGGVATVRGA